MAVLDQVKARANDVSLPINERRLWTDVLEALTTIDAQVTKTRRDIDVAFRKQDARISALESRFKRR